MVRELEYTTQALLYVRGKAAYLFSHNSISSENSTNLLSKKKVSWIEFQLQSNIILPCGFVA